MPQIHHLGYLAALYDLAPRDDEDVEVFPRHLKVYVRTYMQGASTVRGVLRNWPPARWRCRLKRNWNRSPAIYPM